MQKLKGKILIVDDSKTMQRIITSAVASLGYKPLYACDGYGALQLARKYKNSITLILLDLNMPVLGGMETLKALKKDKQVASIPVIIVTIEAERNKVVEAVKAGAKHYLVKPFTQQDLVVKILESLGKAYDMTPWK